MLALRAATTRTSLDRVDDTVEAGACRRARAEWERHLTHRFDRCSTCAKTREIVRANRAFFPIPERRRGVVERIVARVDGARRRAAREGEKDAAARTPARMTPPTGSETTAPVEETVDAGVHASVIERVRTDVDATTIESPNSDDARAIPREDRRTNCWMKKKRKKRRKKRFSARRRKTPTRVCPRRFSARRRTPIRAF